MRSLIPLLLLAFLIATASAGCTKTYKADPKAAAACKDDAKNSDQCRACCREAGAAGHMWTSNSGCRCL
jgi:hypothetical protein